ncbi:hypothetical protein [Brevundimonas sanguinis]|uniref:hypothetical protein n=1 Tax=Brevundimonas sanguinis TaxID=3021811 RepID=UPI0024151147|nr:hypothetical protein [Brevundimonas sp. NCCP 15609]
MTTPEPHLVFQGAAWKSGLRTLGAIGVLAGAVWMLGSDHESSRYPKATRDIIAIGCIIWAGWDGILSFVRLCLPPELVLTKEGFSVRDLGKARLMRWEDIQSFELVERRRGNAAGYVLKPEARRRVRGLPRLRAGIDGTIAVSPEESPGYVVKILNDWRRCYAPPS